MGREVRRVPADWQHPKAFDTYRGQDEYVPLQEGDFAGGYDVLAAEWDEGHAKWQLGLCRDYSEEAGWEPVDPKYQGMRFTDYHGARPSPDDFMPNWPAEQRTHLMMYEDTSEGTPISPALETPEELARWLVDNNASAFAGQPGSYEGWLAVAQGGFAPSCVIQNGEMKSGVEFAGQAA